MVTYIETFHFDYLFDLDRLKKPYPEIADEERKFVAQLLNEQIINSLMAPDGNSADHRGILVYQLFWINF